MGYALWQLEGNSLKDQILISPRMRPFSHEKQAFALIPLTNHAVWIYPTRLHFSFDQIVDIPLRGPVKGFTSELDLERQRIRVFGRHRDGYFVYHVYAYAGQVIVKGQKGIDLDCAFSIDKMGEVASYERLYLGCDKKQDMAQIFRRSDPREYFPLWFSTGQQVVDPVDSGMHLEKHLENHLTGDFASLVEVFETGFRSLMLPLGEDDRFQGVVPVDEAKLGRPSPFILRRGYQLIRDLFFREEKGELVILPHLLKGFVFGKLTNLQAGPFVIGIEWSKKKLRRMTVKSSREDRVNLRLPKGIQSFRLRVKGERKKEVVPVGKPLAIGKNQTLILERFEK
ncbi:MAG: hypothetical protein S4CHLAM102_09310 [Chlamydiia bacterium]|nr:hypothetical protein [Chlamydiia bacterium]